MQIVQTLPDLLLGAGIQVKRYSPGHTEQIRCPKCEGGRTHEVSLSVSIDDDGHGAVWQCHRGTCGWKDGARLLRDAPRSAPPRAVQKPKADPTSVTQAIPDWLFDFFGEREIGARTIKAFGVYATTRNYQALGGERPTIVFPYTFRGELVNRKYRPHPEKQPQQQDKDALPTLFNVDRLGDAPPEIVWVEGEPDVMALFECQIENAVTLKDGAPSSVNDANEKRFEALRTHADLLAKAKRIVLAGDMDTPGLALREELARRLGRHRCWLVTWPEGCKDACDTLRAHGPETVEIAIKDAQPYPISGLQRIQRGTLLALRHGRPPATMTTGAMATDAMLHLPTEGRLVVVTGFPSHGKTTWVRFVMVHTAANEHRRWAVFSPEMQPWEQFAAECAEVFMGKPFWPKMEFAGMSDAEVMDAETWLRDRVTMLVCDAEDEAPTLDWILERARAAVLRDGVTDLLIDPWNEVDQQRATGVTETDYIGRSLQRLKAFGLRHGCNVWIIAHPAKPPSIKPGETRPPPGPYDISSSAHWANKADLGLTVHSPRPGTAQVHLWKPRFRRFGRRGAVAALEFDEITGRYTTPHRPPPDGLPTTWHDAESEH